MDRKPVILIIDDEVSALNLVGYFLRGDFKVIPFTEGNKASHYLQGDRPKPDLILLDIIMGSNKEAGYEICRWLKSNEETRNIPVIFLTQKTEPEEEARGFDFGAADYIVKPINALILKSRIKTHIQLREWTKEIEETQKEIILTLSEVLEFRSEETARHVKRVGLFADFLASKVNLSSNERNLLKITAPMHDIGKVGIRDDVLNNPKKLSDIEFEEMKRHTTIGHNILKESKRELLKTAAIVAHEHHEYWNGKGYPRGVSGEKIDILGRITCVVDVYDALSHPRVYRPEAMTIKEIMVIFKKEKGEMFDPVLADIFLNNIDEFERIRKENPDEAKNNS